MHNFLRPCRALLVILLLASCGKQTNKDVVNQQTRLGHTQHFDIPTPIAFSKVSQTASKDEHGMLHDFMQYNGKLTIGQAIAFYKQEMERSGWDIIDLSGSSEGFLFCTKPNKRCGIQIRANVPPVKHMPTTICLFITTLT